VSPTQDVNPEQRVLIRAPTQLDATLTKAILERGGIACHVCSHLAEICAELDRGAGALLLAEEVLYGDQREPLIQWIQRQPKWSDLPILLVARAGADSPAVAESVESLGNVSVLERPTRAAALVSAVRSALRARQRQYEIRDHLEEREAGLRAQAVLASIVASSDDAIISKTLDGRILTWNGGAERIFGYTADEAVGQPITMLIPDDHLEEEVVLLDRLRRGEHIDHFETVRITKDGRRLDISLTVSPLSDSDGRVMGASKVARDITERKRSEVALRDADRRKDEFLAVLAHELRNPLAPIRNSLHILRLNGQHDPSIDHLGEVMERQVNHMVRLVDDLLEVSRITRGKIELRMQPIEAAAIVRSAVETSRPLIDAAGHQLSLAIPSEPLILIGDPVRLNQVLANLLNNAAKYTERGGQISLFVRREGERVAFFVRDTGMGIPAEMLARIFEMFMQVDREANRSYGGLGIGLTLSKGLVEMHGGTLEAHSEGAGQGSEFVVRLPLAPLSVAAVPRMELKHESSLAPRRVLVVDDNRDAADSLGMVLKRLGAAIRVVYNGADALAEVALFQPHVVMLEIGMSGMDGYEVARRIRSDPLHRDMTLIALTGWGQDEDRRRSQAAGFDYHLIKPTDLGDLQTLLTSLQGPG
jgi:two-component system CheB/CheR fusion protein